jgi:GTP cyclohydrolase I
MLPPENEKKVEEAIRMLLEALGEDVTRPGIKDTPERVARLYSDVLDARFSIFPRTALFSVDDEEGIDVGDLAETDKSSGIVLVTKVPFYAFCEHHLLPWIGEFSLGYLPGEKVLGLSKLIRIFRWFTKRVSIQERVTQQAAEALMQHAHARGAACWVSAEHLCMSLRGVKSPGATTITTAFRGAFLEDKALQDRFLHLIR